MKKELIKKLNTFGLLAMTDTELTKITGFELNESCPVYRSAKELLRRQTTKELKKISSSKDAYELLRFTENEPVEHFNVIYLRRNNTVISVENISKGGICGTVADSAIIIKKAILADAKGIILSHNHPSGETQPSDADKQITNKIKQAALLFDIAILDHVIISNRGYFSFADEGPM